MYFILGALALALLWIAWRLVTEHEYRLGRSTYQSGQPFQLWWPHARLQGYKHAWREARGEEAQ